MMSGEQTIAVEPARAGFAASMTGVDLSAPLSASMRDAIMAAWTTYPVLSFPRQDLTPATLQTFCGALGRFGHDPYVKPMADYPHVIEVKRAAGETAPIFGSLWHSDWSFQESPPSATVLYAVDTPPVGGDTVFADGYRAFAALSPTMQRMLEGLQAVHSAAPSYGPKGLFARDDASRTMQIVVSAEAEQTQVHPLVRRHPLSGRPALYINHVYTLAIVGLHAEESRALLEFLFRHMTRDEFVYRHRWRDRTLLIWDNRCVVHYADGGYEGHQRLMYRTTIAGERPQAVTSQ